LTIGTGLTSYQGRLGTARPARPYSGRSARVARAPSADLIIGQNDFIQPEPLFRSQGVQSVQGLCCLTGRDIASRGPKCREQRAGNPISEQRVPVLSHPVVRRATSDAPRPWPEGHCIPPGKPRGSAPILTTYRGSSRPIAQPTSCWHQWLSPDHHNRGIGRSRHPTGCPKYPDLADRPIGRTEWPIRVRSQPGSPKTWRGRTRWRGPDPVDVQQARAGPVRPPPVLRHLRVATRSATSAPSPCAANRGLAASARRASPSAVRRRGRPGAGVPVQRGNFGHDRAYRDLIRAQGDRLSEGERHSRRPWPKGKCYRTLGQQCRHRSMPEPTAL
jgi:hypothetical protein